MSSSDPRKLAAAIAVLVLAIGMLSLQVVRRVRRPQAVASTGAAAEMMMEYAALETPSVAWSPPKGGLNRGLRRNPFLRPASAPSGGPVVERGVESNFRWRPRLGGIRTGANPMAIIDEQVRTVGDSVQGWRVLTIERNHVTLERSDGRTIDLVAQ